MNHTKKAHTLHPVHDLITERWSARSFSDKAISEHDMLSILEGATWAFSASNEQPWRVIYGLKGTETFNKILEALMPGNTPWAKNAGALILSIAKTTADKEGHPHNAYAEHDLGAFNATLALQAFSMGISAHPMAGFDKQKATELFALEPNMKPMVIFALGHIDSPEKLEEPYKSRETSPRNRKGLSEIVLK